MLNTSLKSVIAAGIACAAVTVASSQASAFSMTGSFGISVYHETTSTQGAITDPDQQANPANPLLSGAAIYSGTYTGDIDFTTNTNTILAFLLSAGGSLSGDTSALSADLSSATFKDTTLIVLTGDTGGFTDSGTITHDDGIGLFNPGLITPAGDEAPTVAEDTNFTGLTGAWTLYYIEANGLPAVLDFEVTSQTGNPTPLPAAVWMFGSIVAGAAGVGRLRRRQKNA